MLAVLPIAVNTQATLRAFDPILGLARAEKLTASDAAYLELAIRLGLPLAARDAAPVREARAAGVPLFRPPGPP